MKLIGKGRQVCKTDDVNMIENDGMKGTDIKAAAVFTVLTFQPSGVHTWPGCSGPPVTKILGGRNSEHSP